jgi:hypothetical protein
MNKCFNLNCSFLVKLTDAGYQRLKEGNEEHLPTAYHKPIEYYKEKADEEGFVSIQGWRLLNYFGGKYSALGVATDYYSLEIKIKADSLFDK